MVSRATVVKCEISEFILPSAEDAVTLNQNRTQNGRIRLGVQAPCDSIENEKSVIVSGSDESVAELSKSLCLATSLVVFSRKVYHIRCRLNKTRLSIYEKGQKKKDDEGERLH